MTEQHQPEQQSTELLANDQKKSNWRYLRWFVYTLIFLLVLLVVGIFALASSDKGSRWLLEFAMDRQKMIQYQYRGGNLVEGIDVGQVVVKVKDTEVKVDQAEIRLGWRAIVNKEVHLMSAQAGEVQVINHAPPKDEDFKFSELKLPFVLRLDDAKVSKLSIINQKSTVNFYDVQLYDAIWSGAKLQLTNSSMSMGFLSVDRATGYIQFDGKYPLNMRANLTIPSLEGLNLHQIKVDARGDLDTVQAGFASATPDIISGYVVAHPLRKNVPMKGKVYWQDFKWPLLTDQELFSKAGEILVSGDIAKLNFNLDTDLSGKNIPQGQYQALMNTDLKQLNIEDFQGQLMKGQLDLAGVLSWQDGVKWDISGNMQGINPKDPVIPAVVSDFLPQNVSGLISSTGSLKNGLDILATVDFKGNEKWNIHLTQGTQKQAPMRLNAKWKQFDRELPYIGWLTSQQGDVDLTLSGSGQDIKVATQVAKQEKSMLPWGSYEAILNFNNNVLSVKDFVLQQNEGRLFGQAVLNVPTENTQLSWKANLNADKFNPQNIAAAAPLNRVDGKIIANGYAKTNQQIIHLESINLAGQLLQGGQVQPVALTGKSTVAVLLHDGKQQSGLKSFAVLYDGALNAKNYSEGPLKLKVSGTPQELNIEQLFHQGLAGKIDARGQVRLANGFGWDLKADLQNFKPNYFVSNVQGNISGKINTSGQWSDKQKFIFLRDLNLHGQLQNKPLVGKGNLALSFTQANGFMPTQFEANNLLLSYANNIVYATGNAQRLQLNVNAPNLQEIYAGLRGTIKGFVSVQSQPDLNVKSNLIAENLGFKNLLDIEKISLTGILPTSVSKPSRIDFIIKNLKSGERKIDNVALGLKGTYRAHILDFSADNQLSKFSSRLAGGFNQQNDWLGQLQKGRFDSKEVVLEQNQNANIVFKKATTSLSMGAHCWLSKDQIRGEICVAKQLEASPQKGDAALTIKNIDLEDFKTFLPAGFSLTGRVAGFANVAWLQNQPMKVDAQFVSKNGTVGLIPVDSTQPVSLDYKEVRIGAQTQPEGLALQFNADTPLLGSGFAKVIVGTTGQDKSLSGLVAVNNMRLDLLKPFISDVRVLKGSLSAAGKLNGTLKSPLFNGEVRLKNGEFALNSVPLDLKAIELSTTIAGDTAKIAGRFNAGQGIGRLDGDVSWKGVPEINLSLSGKDLEIAQPPLIKAQASPFIKANIKPTEKTLSVDGNITIPYALITMPEGGANVVGVTADARIVDSRKQQAYIAAAKAWRIDANVGVELGNNVKFRGFGNDIPLVGRLKLSQAGTQIALRANGAIGVSRIVTIEAYGQRLDLRRAIIRFGGELSNPSLDIDANKSIQGHTIGLQVTGVASRPAINIYNDAGLSEQQAINALLTGRISEGASGVNNTEGFKSDVNNTIAAAGISMGLGGTRALTNQIGRSFGLSGLALDAQGSGDDTQVSVTGYITPDLYLRYGVGIFTPVNKLTLRYQVNRRLYVEATSSLERAVDIFYHWRF